MAVLDLLADLAAAGLNVAAEGEHLVVRPASRLTDAMRDALRAGKPELMAVLQAGAASHRLESLDLVTRTATDAQHGMARPAMPDADYDERVRCVNCRHHGPGRCRNFRHAGLQGPEVGRDLSALLQHCPGFQPVRTGSV